MTRTLGTSGDAAARLTERLLTSTRAEVRLANARAALWLACLAAGTIAFPALWEARGMTPWDAGALASALATAGVVTAFLAAVTLILAVVPRTGQGSSPVVPRMVAELCWLSRLAVLKDRYVRAGMILAAVSGALLLIAGLS